MAEGPPRAPTYVALAGPTASGKTAVALQLAQTLACEIISVDSALVYRGMDIGTAKPSHAERAALPHHLIDIRDPLHAYSAAAFVRDANALIGEIRQRGRLPLLVGGTMLYFKALRDGLHAMPATDAAVRAAVHAQAAVHGWPALHAELAQFDPESAARLHPQDAQRIGRAIEVYRASGVPLSAYHTTKFRAPCADAASPAAQSEHGSEGLLVALEPTERSALHLRIAQRFDQMLELGLIDEVRHLRQRADLHADLPSMRCVGYRQVWAYLQATEGRAAPSPGAPTSLAQLREQGVAATRQLAKRQLTWLRASPERLTVPCEAPDAAQQVLAHLRSAMALQN